MRKMEKIDEQPHAACLHTCSVPPAVCGDLSLRLDALMACQLVVLFHRHCQSTTANYMLQQQQQQLLLLLLLQLVKLLLLLVRLQG